MSLHNMNEMLAKAQQSNYAVANFDIPDSLILRGVMNASRDLRAPVILAYANVFEEMSPICTFSKMLLEEAKMAEVPVCIHLDHARTLESIAEALECGFTSAMFDGSDLPFQENIEKTREAVNMCHAKNASCEAELGHVGGLDGYAYAGDPYTDVEQAKRFVEETGVDALAVSIGTVHGVYAEEPKLSFDRLRELRAALKVPLVLHGGSGLSDDDFRQVIKDGITKVNIFTDLTIRALDELHESDAYMTGETLAINAVADEAEKKLRLFGSAGVY